MNIKYEALRFYSWLKEYQNELSILILAALFGGFMLWMLHVSTDARITLQRDNIHLNSLILEKDSEIAKLKTDLEFARQGNLVSIETPPPSPPVVEQVISKSSAALNNKIEKVQTALIDNKAETRVITQQGATQIVERAVMVDKELKDMMLQSFCNVSPDNPKCKVKKK